MIPKSPEYMSKLVGGVCAYTGHVTWDGKGSDRLAINQSTHIELHPSNQATFTCLEFGTEQSLK